MVYLVDRVSRQNQNRREILHIKRYWEVCFLGHFTGATHALLWILYHIWLYKKPFLRFSPKGAWFVLKFLLLWSNIDSCISPSIFLQSWDSKISQHIWLCFTWLNMIASLGMNLTLPLSKQRSSFLMIENLTLPLVWILQVSHMSGLRNHLW